MEEPAPPPGIKSSQNGDTVPREDKPRRTFPNFNTFVGCLSIVLGVALLLLIPGQVGRPPVFFGISVSNLNPALFPRFVAGGFIVVGALYVLESRRIFEHNDLRDLDRYALFNISVTLLIFCLYVITIQPFGFVISSFIVLSSLSIFYGSRNIVAIFITSTIVPLAVYYIFASYLLVTLPGFPEALRWS